MQRSVEAQNLLTGISLPGACDRDEALVTVRELSRNATHLRRWREFPRFGVGIVTVRLSQPEGSIGQGRRTDWPPDIGAFVQQPNVNHRLSIGILVRRRIQLERLWSS